MVSLAPATIPPSRTGNLRKDESMKSAPISSAFFAAITTRLGQGAVAISAEKLSDTLASPEMWQAAPVNGPDNSRVVEAGGGRKVLHVGSSLLREEKGRNLNAEVRFSFLLGGGVELASLRVQSLPPVDPQFETIPLDHYLNALPKADDMTAAGSTISLDGIPFCVPRTDDRGYDHIDVGRSWMELRSLEGDFESTSWSPENIGRWTGALYRSPGRIAVRILSRVPKCLPMN
jgi:hypothetical protein